MAEAGRPEHRTAVAKAGEDQRLNQTLGKVVSEERVDSPDLVRPVAKNFM